MEYERHPRGFHASDFKVPDLGENIESGDIVSVLVKEGDQVAAQQAVFEVETGKAVVELPTPHAGKITKIHVEKGSKVKVGDSLLTIETGAPAPAAPKAPPAASRSAKPAPAAAEKRPRRRAAAPQPAAPAARTRTAARRARRAGACRQPATPPAESTEAAQKTAAGRTGHAPPGPRAGGRSGAGQRDRRRRPDHRRRHQGRGPRAGRSTRTQRRPWPRRPRGGRCRPAPTIATPGARFAARKMASIRKTIAVNMVRSATTIPHVTNFDDADITELERIRKGGLADYVDSSIKLTMMPFVMKAIAQSLRLHPLINASIDMEAEQIIYKEYVNIGVAVDTERGLVVPVIRDVDRMSIPAIAKALADVAERGRAGPVHARRDARRDVHDQQHGLDRRHLFDADHQSAERGHPADRPLAQAAGGGRRPDRAAADDAAELVVRSSHRRRRHGRPLLERGDQLSEGARPAAAVAVMLNRSASQPGCRTAILLSGQATSWCPGSHSSHRWHAWWHCVACARPCAIGEARHAPTASVMAHGSQEDFRWPGIETVVAAPLATFQNVTLALMSPIAIMSWLGEAASAVTQSSCFRPRFPFRCRHPRQSHRCRSYRSQLRPPIAHGG